MHCGWPARLFFAAVAALALAGVVSGTACTRWGQPGPLSPTPAPLATIFVNANTGSDTSGNGSMTSPFKSMTKAVAVLAAAKILSPTVTIALSSGDYDAANGEVFPIVIPKSVTISGSNYGSGPKVGSYINGIGEDTLFEQLVHAPARTAYATLVIEAGIKVGFGGAYVGASNLSLPSSRAAYASVDDLGTFSPTVASFGAGIVSSLRNVSGILVPGGTLSCASCQIRGNDFGIGAFLVPVATASPYGVTPSVTLTHQSGDSSITAKIVDLITDGGPNVTVSGERFERGEYAFEDAFPRLVFTSVRGAADFGGGAAASPGGNNFIGARRSEISIVRRGETVSALDDTWNANEQRANRGGQYPRMIRFAAGASGRNVTILHDAAGSTVLVGPAPAPTPSPTGSPSTSPSATPT
jgi:hypothetical protein